MAKDEIIYYCDEINRFVSEKLPNGYTAAQLVHSNYRYVEENRDFWIDGMNKIQSKAALLKQQMALEQSEEKPIYYLTFEDMQEDGNNV